MTVRRFDAFSRPGSEVGRYHIIRRLAVGGMAELYLAHARSLAGFEKLVVLKRILPQYAQNPDFVRMFLDEARVAATLDHPNIAQVYDIGEFQGSYFFAMEYVHGSSLLGLMRAMTRRQRPLPLQHAINIVIGVCAGLHHAHEKIGLDGTQLGIVHRDVSPPNIIISFDGTVKVVDFGIAKASTAETATNVGALKGKIPYMSPEQCRGDGVDRRSDIFSIGIILYELTVGRRLFQADAEVAILHRISTGEFVPPRGVHRNYPRGLESIVLRALQMEPEHRLQTARAFQLSLEEYAREHKLAISSARLATFMGELFDADARRWPTHTELQAAPEPVTDHPSIDTAMFSPTRLKAVSPPRLSAEDADARAIDEALERLLSDDELSPNDATHELGAPRKSPAERDLGIDLERLEVEDLDAVKFNRRR